MRVLVTNGKNRIAYNIVRSLARHGVEVYCADFVTRAMSNYSRYCSGHFLSPSPFSEQEEYIEFLKQKIKDLNIDVLMPVSEELYLISRHRDQFDGLVKLAIPNYEQILTAHNKETWESIARNLGIAVPRTIDLADKVDALVSCEAFVFPALIKPKQGGGGWGIRRVDTVDELKSYLASGFIGDFSTDRFILQELIDGRTICVAMILDQGDLKGHVVYRQIREFPAFGGQATCRHGIRHNAAVASLEALLSQLKWHGVCQADFVVDRHTDIPYLIDINPRFWGSLVQAIAAGVDFPVMAFSLANREVVETIKDYDEDAATRWLGGELRGFSQHFRRAESKIAFLREFFWSARKTAMYDDFSLADPLPFLIWGLDSAIRLWKNKKQQSHETLDDVWE